MPDKPTVSAVLIAKNERENIAQCIGALAFCDEIIVVASGSSDGTVEIARVLGALDQAVAAGSFENMQHLEANYTQKQVPLFPMGAIGYNRSNRQGRLGKIG